MSKGFLVRVCVKQNLTSVFFDREGSIVFVNSTIMATSVQWYSIPDNAMDLKAVACAFIMSKGLLVCVKQNVTTVSLGEEE